MDTEQKNNGSLFGRQSDTVPIHCNHNLQLHVLPVFVKIIHGMCENDKSLCSGKGAFLVIGVPDELRLVE